MVGNDFLVFFTGSEKRIGNSPLLAGNYEISRYVAAQNDKLF